MKWKHAWLWGDGTISQSRFAGYGARQAAICYDPKFAKDQTPGSGKKKAQSKRKCTAKKQ